ncbi:MAG TPA: choice-of-anchor V domain-containing protein [Gemmatimonadales bacterium]|jgi:hypothetical protein
MGAALYKDGPPPAHTGGFGEPTCRQCHADAELNDSGGSLLLGGLPGAYEPGRSYDVTVTLRRAGMLRAGFQLAARYAAGDRTGTQAGMLVPADRRTKVLRDTLSGVLYAEHSLVGTTVTAGGDSARWVLRWTAPGTSHGPVVLHVAANAANDDDSPFGDFIYARAVQVPLRRR